uniref:Uncharacterized protein n=1 Tax=Arundo donax TaxID=35708 RepID=A0A0A9FW36_ARUDO
MSMLNLAVAAVHAHLDVTSYVDYHLASTQTQGL